MKVNAPSKDFSFQDFFAIFNEYKSSIIFITLLVTSISYVYLYFKPSIYNSYSIIKVNSYNSTSKDLISKTTSSQDRTKDVIEEISLLSTYKINKKVLNKINFKVQYYQDEGYKKVEIFNTIPILVKNIKILNKKVLNKKISLIPLDSGFKILNTLSYKEKLQKLLFKKATLKFDENKIYNYNTLIKTNYFELYIQKNKLLSTPIYFVINGNARSIYETKIKQQLHISQLEKDTSLIKIAYDDNIPERAQLYVEYLTKNFIEYNLNKKKKQNLKTLNVITAELTKIKKALRSSESQLEAYQKNKSILNPSTKGSLFLKKLSDVEIEVSENNLKQKLISNLLSFVTDNYNLNAIAPSLSKLGESHTLKLITSLQKKQLLIEELSDEYTDAYPKLKILRRQISNIRTKITDNLKSLQIDINYRNQSLLKRKRNYENQLETLPAQERQLINIKRNYEVKSSMYEYLLKKESENKIIQHSTSSNYKIIDNAYTAEQPIKPLRSIILLLSVLLGFIIGFIIALLRQLKNNKVLNKRDLERLTSLPVYGSIPFYKQRTNNIEVLKKVKSPFIESFRTLRTNLQFITKTNSISILITSAIAGEGKTTTVSNLAVILNKARYKTIVINLDLRKPTLHKFFSVDNSIGMSTYLNGQNNISEIISPTEFGELDIIPSGPIPENPSELILSPLLPKLIKELKNKYEYVIIDTAPIGLVSDTKMIMQYSDLNLILIRANYSKSNFLPIIDEMMEKYNFKNIGLILNASKDIGGEYGYGYSYEYQ